MNPPETQDLVVLVPDADIEQTVRGLLSRSRRIRVANHPMDREPSSREGSGLPCAGCRIPTAFPGPIPSRSRDLRPSRMRKHGSEGKDPDARGRRLVQQWMEGLREGDRDRAGTRSVVLERLAQSLGRTRVGNELPRASQTLGVKGPLARRCPQTARSEASRPGSDEDCARSESVAAIPGQVPATRL